MHYVVGVITKELPTYDDICDILATYNENIQVEPYIYKTKQELTKDGKNSIIRFRDDVAAMKKNENESEEAFALRQKKKQKEVAPLVKLLDENDEEAIYNYEKEKYDKDQIDKDGNYISTYNPKSKWDWFSIGGRFGDYFDGFETEGECDSVALKNFPKPKKPSDDEIKRDYPELYNDYEKIKNGTYEGFYKTEYMQELYPTLYDYFNASENLLFYSIVDTDGEWHEPGQMGWFSSLAETKDEVEFRRTFYDKFIGSMNGQGYITLIDCHI